MTQPAVNVIDCNGYCFTVITFSSEKTVGIIINIIKTINIYIYIYIYI